MDFPIMLFFIIVIVFSAIFHEYMHAWVADQLGDHTARHAGRLTLNPKAHIDPFGSVILPLIMALLPGNFLFAYAKPVPFNPYNLIYRRWGPAFVALAGPLSNLFLAFVFGMAVRYAPETSATPFFMIIVMANLALAVFNLVPIPPLDGSKLLYALLPDSMWQVKKALEQYGFVFLLIFIFFLFPVIIPIMSFLFELFTGYQGF